jgi:hypothetical protein
MFAPPRGVVRAPPSSFSPRRVVVARDGAAIPPRRAAPTVRAAGVVPDDARCQLAGRSVVVVAPVDSSRSLASCLAASFAALALAAHPLPALAVGPVSVPLERVTYEDVPCPAGTKVSVGGAVQIKSEIACVAFTARASNPSGKSLNNADVYGRVYDGAGSPVTDVSENNRIAYVDEVKPGESEVTFTLRMSRAQLDAGELTWKGLKASGFAGKILPGQTGQGGLLGADECDLAPDPAECEEERAAMAAIR